MGKIATAVAWAVAIANNSSHGYDQSSRWGPDYDCSSLIIQAWQEAGVPVKTTGASYTGNMCGVFLANGFEDVTSRVTLSTGAGLKAGDVVWVKGHVEMMCSDTQLVGAHISENGTIYAGTQGDQTGREIDVRNYYNKPWTRVLRYMAEWEDITEDDIISANRYLTLAEMQDNAKFIYKQFYGLGWTLNAISGMLGNMQKESTINPGIWQSLKEGNLDGGYGLVQWTPATKLIEWAETRGYDYTHIQVQCMKIHYEMVDGGQYYQTSTYPLSFKKFSESTESPEYLASAFLYNYERPASYSTEAERQGYARYWYDYLKDIDPEWTPTEPEQETKKKGLSLMMMYLATRK